MAAPVRLSLWPTERVISAYGDHGLDLPARLWVGLDADGEQIGALIVGVIPLSDPSNTKTLEYAERIRAAAPKLGQPLRNTLSDHIHIDLEP